MPSIAALDLVVRLKDQASKGIDGLSDGIGGLGKVMGIAGAGALAFGGFLVGAASAAAEEEIGIKRLGVTLQNNIPHWDGNTASLEKYVDKAQQTGFADDQIRDSLNKLIPRTHDLTEAEKLNTIAMDLARGKNIDLATAADVVGKVHDGNVGILARYGIAVDKGATATEALGAIQKTYAGQADAYGATTAGSVDRIKTAFGNIVENVGGAVLGIVQGPLKGLADWLSSPEVQNGIQQLATDIGIGLKNALDAVGPPIATVAAWLGELATGAWTTLGPIIASIATNIGSFFTNIQEGATPLEAIGFLLQDLGDSLANVSGPLSAIVTGIGDFVSAIASSDPTAIATFFSNLGGGPDSAIGKMGGALQEAKNEFVDLVTEITTGGGSADAKQFFIDIEAVTLRLISDWDAFWAPQSEHVIKNKEEWADLQLNGDPTKNGFAANWSTFWTDFNTWFSSLTDGWNTFWGTQKTSQEDYKTRADGIAFDELKLPQAMTDNWNNFWLTTNTSFGGFAAGWNQFWYDVGTGLALLKHDWDALWTDLQVMLINFSTGWNTFWTNIGTALGTVTKSWNDFWSGNKVNLTAYSTAWDTFWTGLWGNVAKLVTGVTTLGGTIVDGLKQGIRDAWGEFVAWFTGLFQGLIDAAVAAIRGGSPSREFADQVGEPIAQGIQMGWEHAWPAVQAKVLGDIGQFIGALPALLPGDYPNMPPGAVLPGDYPGGATLPGDYPGGATLPGDYPGGATLPGDYPGGATLPGDYPGGATLPGDYPGSPWRGGGAGGRMLGSTSAGGSASLNIGTVVIYAGVGTDGAQVASRFLDELEAELGTNVRIRHAGAMA